MSSLFNKRSMILFAASIGSILIVALALFVSANFGQKMDYLLDSSWSFEVELKDGTVISYNMTELVDLDYIERYYYLLRDATNGSENQEGIFRGFSIKHFVNDTLNVTDYTSINVMSIDSYYVSFFKAEIDSEEEIIIAYMMDGNYMQGPLDGGTGPLRLIIPQKYEYDFNAQRCVKYVSRLIFT